MVSSYRHPSTIAAAISLYARRVSGFSIDRVTGSPPATLLSYGTAMSWRHMPARWFPALTATIATATAGKLDASTAATTYAENENAAIGLLFAGLSTAGTAACNVVFTVSSTTAGSNATTESRRYVNLLVSALQAPFPAPGGTEATVVAHSESLWGTVSTTPGVHGYNGGQGGTTAATYMNDAEAGLIISVNPAMVMHMSGSNDYASNVPPATYKAALEVRKNGTLVLNATDSSITALGHVGISGTAALTAFGMDEIAIDAVT